MSYKQEIRNPDELEYALSRQIDSSTGSVGDNLSDVRADLFERYMGEPYGDEVEDRSAVISTDIRDTVEWMMPVLMEMLTDGEKVLEFAARNSGDVLASKQETATVNHVLLNENDGWMAIYSFIKDALIYKTGYVKRVWQDQEMVRVEDYKNLTQAELDLLLNSLADEATEVEVLEDNFFANDDGTLDMSVRVVEKEERLEIVPVPPEEIIVTPRWNKVSLHGCPFVCHHSKRTISEMLELGYDQKQVESWPDSEEIDWKEEHTDRHNTLFESQWDQREHVDMSMREVDVYECYFYADLNGDGVAELNRAVLGGTGQELAKWSRKSERKGMIKGFKAYDVEEIEYIPISSWTPVPIPHKHHGLSIAELVSDIQRIKTVLWRQLLDNTYMSNNPTREIAMDGIGEHTLDDLLVDRPGKIIRTEMPGMYNEHPAQNIAPGIMPVIEYADDVRENRSGVSRYNQGLESDTLNKTAHGIERIMSAGEKKITLVARIFAETGLKDLFLGIHNDLRRNSSRSMSVEMDEGYVDVNPRMWRNRKNLRVTGLGVMDREQMIGRLGMLITEQKEHLMQASPLVTPMNLYNSYEKMIDLMGLKNATTYFNRFEGMDQPLPPPQGEEQPDPTQAIIAAETIKAQTQQQIAQLKAQLDMQKEAAKLEHDKQKMAFEAQLKAAEARLTDDRERDKTNIDAALRRLDIEAKGVTQVASEQIRADAQKFATVNQPPKGTDK